MQPVVVKPPSRWPPRLFTIAGVLCLALAIAALWPLSSATAERGYIEATLEQFESHPESAETSRALLAAHRDARAVVARWQRRAFGLGLTGLCLLLGALFAAGLRQLHDRVTWAFVDEPDETLRDGATRQE